jgi:hypothetical protein
MKLFLPMLLVAIALGAGAALARHPSVVQPLAMSHRRHIDAKGMKCRSCHQGVEGDAQASFPTLADCMDCHKTAQRTDPREPDVREWAKRGVEIPWVRVNRLPSHVYFSHAAHVTLAKMDCQVCHRDMKVVDDPVTEPDVHLDMDACIACHREKKATVECVGCHR